jgi:LmbE family N-acetylglucosaminyl deacetylase
MRALSRVLLKRLSRKARPYLQSAGLLQTVSVYARTAISWSPGKERVLVLAPHMDDETIGCGGTLALHVQNGAKVTVAFMTDGRSGADVSTLTGAERIQREQALIDVRKLEARRALSELGIENIAFLDGPDGHLQPEPALCSHLQALIDRCRPELVYVPHFLEEHGDHRATTAVLLAATAHTSWSFQCMGYEVWTPLFPNCLVNIDSTVQLKRQALAHYASQLEQTDYLHTCLGLNAHRSVGLLNARGGYAEAFCAVSLAEYREQFEEFCQQRARAVG